MNNQSLNSLVYLIFGDRNHGLTKIKNTERDSVYACECITMLRKDKHYMFVIGAKDIISIGANVRMEDIANISCIQFRTFTEPILQKVLSNKVEFKPALNEVLIKRYNINNNDPNGKISEYLFEYDQKPYNVHLFHTSDSDFEYVADGTLYSAVITWNTMIMPSINVVSKQLQAPPRKAVRHENIQSSNYRPISHSHPPTPQQQQGGHHEGGLYRPQIPKSVPDVPNLQPYNSSQSSSKRPTYSQYQQNALSNKPY